jgi:tetratricopeptide (TPR) repeat protein
MPKTDIRPLIQKGLKELGKNDYQTALQTFKTAAAGNPEHPVPYLFETIIFLILNQNAAASESLEKGIKKDSKNLLGKNLTALLQFREGKKEEALTSLKKTGIAENPRIQALLLYEIEKNIMEMEKTEGSEQQ